MQALNDEGLATQEVAEQTQVLVTMGCGDECPFVPGATRVDYSKIRTESRSKRFAKFATKFAPVSRR
jgi:hypothetical protein